MNYRFWLKAEIGNKPFVATADDGEDAIEIGVRHGRTRRKAEPAVEQILSYFAAHHP